MNVTLRGTAHLDLVCRACTRTAKFPALDAKAAVDAARAAGWRKDARRNEFTCPKCSHPVVEPRRSMISGDSLAAVVG